MVKAMQEHVSSEGVQEEGCLALWNLAAYSADNTVAIAAKGGMEAVAKAMQEHVSSAGVQEQMCRALGNLAVNADNKVAAQLTGGKSLVGTSLAFAAVKSDGSVVTWGSASWGGDSSSVAAQLTGVESVAAARHLERTAETRIAEITIAESLGGLGCERVTPWSAVRWSPKLS